mmetsp:Transcript_9857/g.30375  ORF Transcript_9857/g.30375 Transcript_9857/m.30375 type:complete len:255 (+) Transcript_9857:57-821(+)
MASIGTGYDLSCSTFSPDGRIFQIEYASKAVENSSTSIALRVKDGVVLAAEKLIHAQMMIPESNRRIDGVDSSCGLAISGLIADSRQLIARSRNEAASYKSTYGDNIPVRILATRIASYVHAYTLYSSVRPFGCASILAGVDKDGPAVFVIEPSGVSWGFHAAAVGKGRQTAKTELEKLKLEEMTCREALKEAARIIALVHDDTKDKPFELELAWVCEESNNKYERVPTDLHTEAMKSAEGTLDEMDDEDDFDN